MMMLATAMTSREVYETIVETIVEMIEDTTVETMTFLLRLLLFRTQGRSVSSFSSFLSIQVSSVGCKQTLVAAVY